MELNKTNILYVDPGKIRLVTMINDKDIVFKYSAAQNLYEPKGRSIIVKEKIFR